MKGKWRGADQLGSEAPRRSDPVRGGKFDRDTKGQFVAAGQVALAMLHEIRRRKSGK